MHTKACTVPKRDKRDNREGGKPRGGDLNSEREDLEEASDQWS